MVPYYSLSLLLPGQPPDLDPPIFGPSHPLPAGLPREYCRRVYAERYEAVARGIVLQLEQKRRQSEREKQQAGEAAAAAGGDKKN